MLRKLEKKCLPATISAAAVPVETPLIECHDSTGGKVEEETNMNEECVLVNGVHVREGFFR